MAAWWQRPVRTGLRKRRWPRRHVGAQCVQDVDEAPFLPREVRLDDGDQAVRFALGVGSASEGRLQLFEDAHDELVIASELRQNGSKVRICLRDKR